MMSTEEIDISNPEVTVKHMVEKVKSLKEDALKARELEEKFDEKINEIEAKYKSDVEQLKLKVSELEELVVKYKGLSDELLKLVDDLRERTTKTLSFFMVVVPKKLPTEVRSIYASQLQQVKEIWGVEHE
jgi:phage host-nuclease inhibitor protein Gam